MRLLQAQRKAAATLNWRKPDGLRNLKDWQALAQRLRDAQVNFVMEPQLRFAGQSGEQWTMFFLDPSGNPLEIKGFASLAAVYAR